MPTFGQRLLGCGLGHHALNEQILGCQRGAVFHLPDHPTVWTPHPAGCGRQVHFLFNVNIAGGQCEMMGITKLEYLAHRLPKFTVLQLVFKGPELEEEECACPTPWAGPSPTRHHFQSGTTVVVVGPLPIFIPRGWPRQT